MCDISEKERSKITKKTPNVQQLVPFLNRRHCTGLNVFAQCCIKQREARQMKEFSHHLGKRSLIVAPISMVLRVSDPRSRLKLLKTAICHKKESKGWQRPAG